MSNLKLINFDKNWLKIYQKVHKFIIYDLCALLMTMLHNSFVYFLAQDRWYFSYKMNRKSFIFQNFLNFYFYKKNFVIYHFSKLTTTYELNLEMIINFL